MLLVAYINIIQPESNTPLSGLCANTLLERSKQKEVIFISRLSVIIILLFHNINV